MAAVLAPLMARPDDEDVEIFGRRTLIIRERAKGFDARVEREAEHFNDEWRGVWLWLEIEGRP